MEWAQHHRRASAASVFPDPTSPSSPVYPASSFSHSTEVYSQCSPNASDVFTCSPPSPFTTASLSHHAKIQHRISGSTVRSSMRSTPSRGSIGEAKGPLASTPPTSASGLIRRTSSGSASATSMRATRQISGPIFTSASSGIDLTAAEAQEQRRNSLSDSRPSSLKLGPPSPLATSPESSSIPRRGRLLSTAYEEDAQPTTPRHRDNNPLLKSKFSQSPAPTPAPKPIPVPQRLDFLRKSFSDRARPDINALCDGNEAPRSASPTFSIKARTRKVLGALNVNIPRGLVEPANASPTTPMFREDRHAYAPPAEDFNRRFSANAAAQAGQPLELPQAMSFSPQERHWPASAGHIPMSWPPDEKATERNNSSSSGKPSMEHMGGLRRAM